VSSKPCVKQALCQASLVSSKPCVKQALCQASLVSSKPWPAVQTPRVWHLDSSLQAHHSDIRAARASLHAQADNAAIALSLYSARFSVSERRRDTSRAGKKERQRVSEREDEKEEEKEFSRNDTSITGGPRRRRV
jgi:hypothetical protein